MITRIPAEARHHFKQGWLSTYHLFSFAHYFDPNNLQFGTLRVFNDDTIDAYAGFDEHGHDNMEIVTIMHTGVLTHRDSMGNQAQIQTGEVQRMSAGTGVVHAEKNLGDEPVHLYQLWFLPEKQGLEPSYDQKDFSYQADKNTLFLIASPQPTGEAMSLQADARIFQGEFEVGATQKYVPETGRGVFIYLQTGAIELGDVTFVAGDQARITAEAAISFHATQPTKLIFIDVPVSP